MKTFLLLIAFSTTFALYGQNAKNPAVQKNIIIDTDCGLDDLWAIAILLSRPEIHIKAIIVSEGCLPPSEGAVKVASLLHTFGTDSIIIATGKSNPSINPKWRTFCSQIKWGEASQKRAAMTTDELFNKFGEQTSKFTFVCLGSLTTADAVKTKFPEIFKQIDRIIWYSTSATPLTGFNYECDTTSAKNLITKGKIRIDVVTNPHNTVLFDNSCYKLAKASHNKLSKLINHTYNQPVLNNNLTHAGKKAADELVALYLLAPELFNVNLKVTNTRLRWVESFDTDLVKEMLNDIIAAKYTSEKNIVFNEFPVKRELFNYDVRQILDSAIKKHGFAEWKACVITDEFHGHLGVFSIVGTKMGIKARELFGVGPDQLSVLSFAGNRPPYSCLTDGIQVSTGATMGQGLIRISSDTITKPSAIFTYKNRSVRITLKKEYLKMIDKDIETGIVKFGLADDGYWKLVRKAALNYWLNWSRNDIFEVEDIKP